MVYCGSSNRMEAWKQALKARVEQYLRFVVEVAKVVIIALAIIIPVRYFLIQPFYVKGASMEPNFHNYEYLIIDELSYRFHPPQRGDVVVMRNPQREKEFFIKRVIGLPSETIEIKEHGVYINNERLDESPYLADSVETWGNQKVKLKDNEYFILGDNRTQSLDSRVFGPITPTNMVGRTWVRAWPFTRADIFETVQY